MSFSLKNINKNVASHSIFQSQNLQQNLKILSMSSDDIDQLACDLFSSNPAIDNFKPKRHSSFFGLSENIKQPQKEVFLEQIPTKLLSTNYKVLAEEIFSSLDQEGFLQQEEKTILNDKYGPQIDEVIQLMQQYAELAHGNRLKYWISLLKKKTSHQPCLSLLLNYYDDFLKADFQSISKKSKVSLEDLKKSCIQVLKTLPLSPLKPLDQQKISQYIDLEILPIGGYLDVCIANPLPEWTLNALTDSRQNDVKEFYKPFLEEIRLFQISIKKRHDTLEAVVSKIIPLQKDYLFGDTSQPKAINPKKLAEELELHPSTLARALQHKTLKCVHGIIFLKDLVTPSAIYEDKKSLLKRLKDLISKEDKSKPYSDEKLLEILKSRGSKISRRTLTKYRHQLKIPDARRRFFN